MPKVYFCLVFALFLSACGPAASGGPEPGSPEAKMAQGLECLRQGDPVCAEENYCSLPEHPQAALRCCLAGLIQTVFSENTQSLGRALGYEPLSLKEIRNLSREEILEKKALPFGELFLQPQEEGVDYRRLLKDWFLALEDQGVSTGELNQRLRRLGESLESGLECLNTQIHYFRRDTLTPGIFNSEEKLPLENRDLLFVKFFLGTTSYLLQGLSHYEWGFEIFPSLLPEASFWEDLNGQAGVEDHRFGDLGKGGAEPVSVNFRLLVGSFDALKAFSQLNDVPTKIDAYLNWRLSAESQYDLSNIFSAIYLSLKKGEWFLLPDEEHAVNFFPLSMPEGVPDGRKVSRDLPVFQPKEEGGWRANPEFFREFLAPILRPATSGVNPR